MNIEELVSELMLAAAVAFGALAVVCGAAWLVLYIVGRCRGWR